MEKLWVIIPFLCPIIITYLLYINGYFQLKFTRAIVYMGSMGNLYKNYHKATIVGCSGSIKRRLKFKKNKESIFILNSAISKGTLTVNVLDSKKNIILTLDNENKTGHIMVNQNERYHLVIKYDKADGNYELNWK